MITLLNPFPYPHHTHTYTALPHIPLPRPTLCPPPPHTPLTVPITYPRSQLPHIAFQLLPFCPPHHTTRHCPRAPCEQEGWSVETLVCVLITTPLLLPPTCHTFSHHCSLFSPLCCTSLLAPASPLAPYLSPSAYLTLLTFCLPLLPASAAASSALHFSSSPPSLRCLACSCRLSFLLRLTLSHCLFCRRATPPACHRRRRNTFCQATHLPPPALQRLPFLAALSARFLRALRAFATLPHNLHACRYLRTLRALLPALPALCCTTLIPPTT